MPIFDTPDIAAALRLTRAGREFRGACPACRYPGAFRVATKAGRTVWHCASCADGRAVATAIRAIVGAAVALPSPPVAKLPGNETRTARALAIWDRAVPIPGTIAATYLASRGLPNEASAVLRFHDDLRHVNSPGTYPVMVALVTNSITGEAVAVHRTYLRQDGTGKAALEPAKASLGAVKAGAIMLHNPEPCRPLIIAEGIESALSAGRIMGFPAWASVSAGNMKALRPPADVSEIIIASDPDVPGQKAAGEAARLWRIMGFCVRIAVPNDPGLDFNDLQRHRARGEAHG
jgi:DNA primase